MSADLFAEFGNGETSALPTSTPIDSIQVVAAGDDDDGWGDFEDPAPAATSPQMILQDETPYSPRRRIVRAATIDLMTNNLVELEMPVQGGDEASQTRSRSINSVIDGSLGYKAKAEPHRVEQAPDVLFDAETYDEDEDDDFGDFETSPAKQDPPNIDLLSLDGGEVTSPTTTVQSPSSVWTIPQSPRQQQDISSQIPAAAADLYLGAMSPSLYPQPPVSPAFLDRTPFPGLAVKTPETDSFPVAVVDRKKSPSPVTAWPGQPAKSSHPEKEADWSDENGWEAFDDVQASAFTDQGSGQLRSPIKEAPNDSSAPPSNVPPPSILMSILPSLLEQVIAALLEPSAAQPPETRADIYSDFATSTFLTGYLALVTVAAHIIAGRKLRWIRDKFLSQSMTISAAGGKGGMKLVGIDKSRSAHDDREAADIVALWRSKIVGRLRSVVVVAKASSTQLRVPDVSDQASIQTMKAGTVPVSPKACVICGLKRDERVKGVDIDVEDSFGEWWVDHWGHRGCRNFWLQHEGDLRQR